MSYKLLIFGLTALLLLISFCQPVIGATQLDYYCPPVAYVNQSFTIWADYEYTNSSDILNAIVNLSNATDIYNLSYSNGNSRYQNSFLATYPFTWNYTIAAGKTSYSEKTANCSTDIVDTFNMTIRLWEEVERRIMANTSEWAIAVKNYDKQLTDPYINDFAYIIARNNDVNASGLYTYCNVPFGSGQSFTDLLNVGNWMGDNITRLLTNYTGDYIGCNRLWFRANYTDGEATLELPYIGNYSLYLIEGVIMWENEFAPPEIVKSNLFFYLGEINQKTKKNLIYDFWISHEELDYWGSLTDSIYIFMVTILPIVLVIGLMFIGLSLKQAVGIALMWNVIWTVLRML